MTTAAGEFFTAWEAKNISCDNIKPLVLVDQTEYAVFVAGSFRHYFCIQTT